MVLESIAIRGSDVNQCQSDPVVVIQGPLAVLKPTQFIDLAGDVDLFECRRIGVDAHNPSLIQTPDASIGSIEIQSRSCNSESLRVGTNGQTSSRIFGE
jgi:hypothetical protein